VAFRTAIAVVVLAVAGCGGSHHHPKAKAKAKAPAQAGHAPDASAQLTSLLDTRAAAIRSGDTAKLLGTSIGAQRRRDRRAAIAAKSLPLSAVSISAKATDIGTDRAVIDAQTAYAFTGVGSHFVKRSRITAVRTRAGWRVRRDRGLGVKAPWELGRYTARNSAHFLALAPRGLRVSGLMTDLERGRAQMHRALPGVPPPGRLLVVVARGNEDTRALTRDVRTLGSLTALAEARVVTGGPALRVKAVSGQRVLVLWRSYGSRPAAERRMVIAHELTHAALARRTTGRTPAWLVEGIAMYASGDQRAAEAGALLSGARLTVASQQRPAERMLSLARLARPDALTMLGAIPLSVAYSYASAAAYAIAAKHGRSGLLRLYQAFNDESIRGRAGHRLDDRVMRHALHESLDQVKADADAFARAHAGV
jgi:hypothetical protein